MYKHLDEQTMQQYGSAWIPAIPLPYYTNRGVLRKMGAQCGCGARFDNEAVYREHYRTEQMLEMNQKMARARDISKVKALFWRRYAFVIEHGNASEKKELKLLETPEMKSLADLEILTAQVTDLWHPAYVRYAKDNDVSIGRMADETTIEDETPEEARRG